MTVKEFLELFDIQKYKICTSAQGTTLLLGGDADGLVRCRVAAAHGEAWTEDDFKSGLCYAHPDEGYAIAFRPKGNGRLGDDAKTFDW